MYTELEIAIALNRKCCSSWNVWFLRWQMPRFQINSHTSHVGMWECLCVLCVHGSLLFLVPKQVFQVRVYMQCRSSSVSTTLWRFHQLEKWMRCQHSTKHLWNWKPVCRQRRRMQKFNETKQNKTCYVSCCLIRCEMVVYISTKWCSR